MTLEQHLRIYRAEIIDALTVNQDKRLYARNWLQRCFAEFEGWWLYGELAATHHELRLMEERVI